MCNMVCCLYVVPPWSSDEPWTTSHISNKQANSLGKATTTHERTDLFFIFGLPRSQADCILEELLHLLCARDRTRCRTNIRWARHHDDWHGTIYRACSSEITLLQVSHSHRNLTPSITGLFLSMRFSGEQRMSWEIWVYGKRWELCRKTLDCDNYRLL